MRIVSLELNRPVVRMWVLPLVFAFAALDLCRVGVCDPIHSAAQKGDLAKVKELITADPSLVSAKDKMGATPLHLAAKENHKDVAEFLLASGADVNAKDSNGGFTPLDFALGSYRYIEVVTLLIGKGADVNARSGQGLNALMETAMRGQKDAAALLMAKGADVNAVDSKGNTALHLALMMGHLDFARILIEANEDVNARNGFGLTPLALAKKGDDVKLIDLLKQHGARE